MKKTEFWLAALFVIMLAGCGSPPRSAQQRAVERTSINDITDDTLAVDYSVERSYRRDKSAPLKLGLALSGGGSKAAMFSHGVLNGLHDAGVLQKVDVISSVSGGGYAAYWYFTKLLAEDEQGFEISHIFEDCIPKYWIQFDQNKIDPELETAMERAIYPALRKNPDPRVRIMPECQDKDHFAADQNDPFRWQAHLVRWPDIFGTSPANSDGTVQGKPEKEIRTGLFDGLFLEPVTQALKHQSSVPMLYQWGIERTWGLNPYPRILDGKQEERAKWRYSNAAPLDEDNAPLHVDSTKVTWRALRALYDRSAISPSAVPIPLWIVNANSGSKSLDAQANATRNFEITAFGSGTEQHGYVNNLDTPPIKDLGTSVRAAAGFADAQGLTPPLGDLLTLVSNIIPGARWGVPVEVSTKSGTFASLRLSDGGGAENLGLYSLLKRGVKDIIVVDTAQDIEGNMEDLCTVRRALGTDIEMQFPMLSNFDRVCNGELAYNLSDWQSPIVKGTVTWKRNGTEVRQSRIWLIKAAWNQRLVTDTYTDRNCGDMGRADCFLTVFYGHNSDVRIHGGKESSGNMVFPQLSTAGSTANSSSYLFWGYRELGRSMARQLAWNSNTDELDTVSTECPQRATAKVKGDRPYSLPARHASNPCPPVDSIAPSADPVSSLRE